MPRSIITDQRRREGSLTRRVLWFTGIWAASVLVVGTVAFGLKWIILGG